ncbi:HAD-IB family hydrolase [Sporosarcina oncorhynchi]|uniref:HAD-IB family hydrolase n=1 Tax=Sporosarcina oncorhynchi TaxID=3056444 RepID=A0ABZ0L887_9BACL|nr:HAD-IB family hydrolase [Sporosarcina sp. T2O-4]WOV88472.1 HAD-IB family hydrolase [Sporosarcina sp. T2O-4]
MKVAIFDFDGTLYAEETFQLLMKHLKHHPQHNSKYKSFFRKILPLYIGYKAKVVPESTMKERSMQLYASALQSLDKSGQSAYFKEMKEAMQANFNKDVIERIKQHELAGIHIMLVSGAYTPLLHAVTTGLPFNDIIGTEIPYSLDGRFDTQTKIYHIQGKRKNEMIMKALADKEVDWSNSFAYGDSYSDLPVLELVGNPIAVKPEKRLHQIANDRSWEVL